MNANDRKAAPKAKSLPTVPAIAFGWDESFYCLSLDSKKAANSIDYLESRSLCSGLAFVPPERAKRRLCNYFKQICSLAGVNPLDKNPAYSDWLSAGQRLTPHDNAFIAAGLKRARLLPSQSDCRESLPPPAASRMTDARTVCQVNVSLKASPCLTRVIPAGVGGWSDLLVHHTILGLETDTPHRRLKVEPVLPEWLPDLELTNLMGDATVALRFWREGSKRNEEVTKLEGRN